MKKLILIRNILKKHNIGSWGLAWKILCDDKKWPYSPVKMLVKYKDCVLYMEDGIIFVEVGYDTHIVWFRI